MLSRFALCLMLLLALSFRMSAQVGNPTPQPIDSTESQIDSTGAPRFEMDTTDSFPGGRDELDRGGATPFFTRRSGIFVGPTVEMSQLSPGSLDPILGGSMVIYGGQAYLMLNGWLVGGGGWSSVLYDLNPKYDQFSFGYAGLLLGYDQGIFGGRLTVRPTLLLGAGGLTMIKKRPDIVDTTGHEILERYRSEDFFCMRPGISVGFMPFHFLDLRFVVDYLLPVGGAHVSDLKALDYGLQVMFGFGQ